MLNIDVVVECSANFGHGFDSNDALHRQISEIRSYVCRVSRGSEYVKSVQDTDNNDLTLTGDC